jgi:acetylglutamate kinase
MDKELELVEHKASILIDALPYIRDFNQKTVVIEYGCAEWLSGVEETDAGYRSFKERWYASDRGT